MERRKGQFSSQISDSETEKSKSPGEVRETTETLKNGATYLEDALCVSLFNKFLTFLTSAKCENLIKQKLESIRSWSDKGYWISPKTLHSGYGMRFRGSKASGTRNKSM